MRQLLYHRIAQVAGPAAPRSCHAMVFLHGGWPAVRHSTAPEECSAQSVAAWAHLVRRASAL